MENNITEKQIAPTESQQIAETPPCQEERPVEVIQRVVRDLGQRVNSIVTANTVAFDDAFFSEPLSDFAVDFYRNQKLTDLFARMVGVVKTSRRFEYRVWGDVTETTAAGLISFNEVRALGAQFDQIDATGEIVLGKTDNCGLSARIDQDMMDADPNWEVATIRRLTYALLRKKLTNLISLISTTATDTAVTWNGGAGQDPDGDLLTLVNSNTYGGLRPNVLFISSSAWAARVSTLRAQSTPIAYSSPSTPEELGQMLGCRVVLDSEGFDSTPEVFLYFIDDYSNLDDASTYKSFESLCSNGAEIRAFKTPVGSKLADITVEHYYNLQEIVDSYSKKLTVTTT